MSITAANGVEITDDMLEGWFEALDNDRWPEGWRNMGEVMEGQPPSSSLASEPVTVYMPQGVKEAVERKASRFGVSISAYICGVLMGALAAED